ncbi:NAD(P)-dependent oxidoreductase [Serratia sp. Leaf50]|nr:NAD(P)-dependent oxidoreductase [Serratia sp. Leaf50]
MPQRLLVTGAAGHLGRRVIEILLERNATSIVATTRDPSKLADLAAKGVEVRAADFDKPETLAPAFAGVDRLLLISTDAIYVPGQRLAQHKAAIAAAEKAGVRHIVYTSLPAPQPSSESVVEDDHFWTEQTIAASAMSWTFMRHALYSDNLLWALPQAIATGTLATATANKGRHSVTREDCARADAAVLASEETGRRVYEITGPAAVTAEEVASIVTALAGKPVVHAEISPAALREGLTATGLPSTVIGALVGFDVATSLGFHTTVTSAIEDLTGGAPTSVRDFLTAHQGAFLPPSTGGDK